MSDLGKLIPPKCNFFQKKKKKLPQKLVPAKISTVKLVNDRISFLSVPSMQKTGDEIMMMMMNYFYGMVD